MWKTSHPYSPPSYVLGGVTIFFFHFSMFLVFYDHSQSVSTLCVCFVNSKSKCSLDSDFLDGSHIFSLSQVNDALPWKWINVNTQKYVTRDDDDDDDCNDVHDVLPLGRYRRQFKKGLNIFTLFSQIQFKAPIQFQLRRCHKWWVKHCRNWNKWKWIWKRRLSHGNKIEWKEKKMSGAYSMFAHQFSIWFHETEKKIVVH